MNTYKSALKMKCIGLAFLASQAFSIGGLGARVRKGVFELYPEDSRFYPMSKQEKVMIEAKSFALRTLSMYISRGICYGILSKNTSVNTFFEHFTWDKLSQRNGWAKFFFFVAPVVLDMIFAMMIDKFIARKLEPIAGDIEEQSWKRYALFSLSTQLATSLFPEGKIDGMQFGFDKINTNTYVVWGYPIALSGLYSVGKLIMIFIG